MSTAAIPVPYQRTQSTQELRQRVTVGIDGSYWGGLALTWALRYASLRDAQLDVVRSTAANPLAELIAASIASDLLILGCRGEHHRQLGIGEVVLPAIAAAHCDVLVVRGTPVAIHGGHQRITALINGDLDDVAVLKRGVEMAITYGSQLYVTYALAPTPVCDHKSDRILNLASLHMDRFARKPFTTMKLIRAFPHEVIAQSTNTDLIVLGQGNSLDRRTNPSAVVKAALHHAPCPVLVVSSAM